MQLKQKMITIISLASLMFGANVNAKVLFQAGDIANGQTYIIDKNSGVASYYKDGKSGIVTFQCMLKSNDEKSVNALLTGGKNFSSNNSEILSAGENGPFIWSLQNHNENNGNIKVRLIKGNSATLQCKELNYAEGK